MRHLDAELIAGSPEPRLLRLLLLLLELTTGSPEPRVGHHLLWSLQGDGEPPAEAREFCDWLIVDHARSNEAAAIDEVLHCTTG